MERELNTEGLRLYHVLIATNYFYLLTLVSKPVIFFVLFMSLVGERFFSSVPFKQLPHPSRTFDSPHKLLPELQINKDTTGCAARNGPVRQATIKNK